MIIFLGFFTPSLGSGTKTSPKGPGGMKFIGTNALTSLGEIFLVELWRYFMIYNRCMGLCVCECVWG